MSWNQQQTIDNGDPDRGSSHDSGMIARICYGWPTPGNADAHESLLKSEIFVGIQNRRIKGFRGIQLLRRALGVEVEFVTIMWFDSLEGVRTFSGQGYEVPVVPRRPGPSCRASTSARSTTALRPIP